MENNGMKFQLSMSAEASIERMEQEVRAWSIVVSNLKKQNAPLEVWKSAAKEISNRVKEINSLRGGKNN
jgi:hypothetical protein